MLIEVDVDILDKLGNEGILQKTSTKGFIGYVYANSKWRPVVYGKGTLLKYDDDFFEHAYIDRNGMLDSDGATVLYMSKKEMSPDEIEQFIRDTGKKFADTYLEMKNRETMRAIDALN
jgi:hypothetical protein